MKNKKYLEKINKQNISPIACAITGFLLTIIIGFIIFKLKPFNLIEYLNNKPINTELILFVPATIIILLIHELIHIGFYLLFSKGKAKIQVKREKEYGALMIYQINEKVCYSRNEMILILLAPLILITIILFILINFINTPFLLYINLLLNVLGSSIDFYISAFLLIKYPSNIKISFNPNKTEMIIKSFK